MYCDAVPWRVPEYSTRFVHRIDPTFSFVSQNIYLKNFAL
jgi:hypothetical protein